jgi:hypothetical protein
MGIFLGCMSVRAEAAVLYVARAASGNVDGSSWTDAFTTIQDGINAAGPGDEVWVGAGTYRENVQLHNDIALYGGFAGTEEARDDRNPAAHFTSIDAGKSGSAVRFDPDATPQTVLDGFRLRNGMPDDLGGGGVYLDGGSPVIANNVFTENKANQGAGIVVRNGAPTIANNLFFENSADYGAAIQIYQNTADTLMIVNNTVVDNHSGDGGFVVGMQSGANVQFANNIVAFNDRQIFLDGSSSAAYENNNAWENSDFNYFGGDPTGSNGNIEDDPLFQDRPNGNYRLTPASPCLDAGNNADVIGEKDLDNGDRIQADTVDMGGYENAAAGYHLVFAAQPAGGSAGAPLAAQPVLQVEDSQGQPVIGYNGPVTVSIDPGSGIRSATLLGSTTVNAVDGVAAFTGLTVLEPGDGFVMDAVTADTLPAQSRMFTMVFTRIYVSKSGSDAKDGRTWENAKLTVQSGLDAAPTELWVAAGTYVENLSTSTALAMYGGFAGTESAIADRNLAANHTILDGGSAGTVLSSTAVPSLRVLDGFTIQNGKAAGDGGGAAISAFRGSIANVTFSNNTASGKGGGLFINSSGLNEPFGITLSNDVFTSNSAGQGGGIYLDASNNGAAVITIAQTNNAFSGNSAVNGGGAYLMGDEHMDVCQFQNNTASVGGAVYQTNTLTASGCAFANNGVVNSAIDAAGGAVYSGEDSGLQSYGCQFTGNHISAVSGKAAVGGAWAALANGSLYAPDSVFTGNSAGSGGALYGMRAGNIMLSTCRVQGNSASGSGGAVFVGKGPFSSQQSLFTGNSAGGYGGALVFDTAPVGHDQANQVYLLNNTISENSAAGGAAAIDARHYTEMRLLNNLIAFNGSGIRLDATSQAWFYNNGFFSNGAGTDFQGLASPVGSFGNIGADPLFANRAGGDFHLAAGSPAVDSGDTGPWTWFSTDLDVQRRVQGARVDMGPYERAGETALMLQFDQNVAAAGLGRLTVQPIIHIVDTDGQTPTAYSGLVTVALKSGYGTAGATLGGTTTAPFVNGIATFTDLSVDKGGTGYALTASIADRGGADSNEFTVTIPLVRVSPTGSDSNDGASWASPKRTLHAAFDETAADGSVWIKGGYYFGSYGLSRNFSVLGGFAGAETAASHRDPKANVVTLDGGGLGSVFNCFGQTADTPVYDGMTFTNGSGFGGGIIVYNGAPTISNNVFSGNDTVFGGGILTFTSNGSIRNNTFTANSAGLGGGAIYLSHSTVTVRDNLFARNSNANQDGEAIAVDAGSNVLLNNTFVSNSGPGGVVALHSSAATVVNNIIANNGSGLARSEDSSAALVERANLVFNNAQLDYINITAGAGDISADPIFVDAAAGDYRLAGNSPALDAGDDTVVNAGDLDLSGGPRKQGAHVDIGAYEASSSPFGIADAVRALKIAGGLTAAAPADKTRLDVEASVAVINIVDALRLARRAAGRDPNP